MGIFGIQENLEYIMLISMPSLVIAVFLSISVIYADFSIVLFSSIFLITW